MASGKGPLTCRRHRNASFPSAGTETDSLTAKLSLRFPAHAVERFSSLLGDPQFMQQHSEFASHRDNRTLLGVLASALTQLQSPALEGAIGRIDP